MTPKLQENVEDDQKDLHLSIDEAASNETKKASREQLLATFTLCWCTLTHAWLLISVFPYSGFMAVDLVDGLTEETAGSYAGLIASAFMMGRAFSSYGWGKVADCYGRQFVLIVSLALSMIFSILFGLSPTFGFALFWRFMLGLANGIIGTAKSIVSEMAYGNDNLEAKSMGLVMGMWGWGFLFSPALSGILAEPLRQFPDAVPDQFVGLLTNFPFILPNLLSAIYCFTAIVAIRHLVPETLPNPRHPRHIPRDICAWILNLPICHVCSKRSTASNEELSTLLDDGINDRNEDQQSQYDSVSATSRDVEDNNNTTEPTIQKDSASENTRAPKTATIKSLWLQRNTRNHLLANWVYAFMAVALEEAFPLYCISRDSGLGLSEVTIGKLLSMSGLLFAMAQYVVYSYLVDKFGLRRAMQIGAILSGPLLVLLPISRHLNRGAPDESLTWISFTFLTILLACYRVFSLCFFSGVSVATNRTVHVSHRGTVNGLGMLGGSITKGLGPIFAGTLVAFSTSSGIVAPEFGGIVIFSVLGLVGVVAVVMIFCLLEEPRPPKQH